MNLANNLGETPLMAACKRPNNTGIVRYLAGQTGLKVDAQSKTNGATALTIAIALGNAVGKKDLDQLCVLEYGTVFNCVHRF